MKKIILITLLFVSTICYSQGEFYIGNHRVLKDSSGIIVAKYPWLFPNSLVEYGNGMEVNMNFRILNDEGEINFKKNGVTILQYDDDGNFWDFKFPVFIDGEPVGTSSFTIDTTRLAYLDKRNEFGDSNVYKGETIFDDKTLFQDSVVFNHKVNLTDKLFTTDTIYGGGKNIFPGLIQFDDATGNEMTLTSILDASEGIFGTLSNLAGYTSLFDVTISGTLEILGYVNSNLLFQKNSAVNIGTTDSFNVSIVRDDTAKVTLTPTGVSIGGILSIISMTTSSTSLFSGIATFASDVIFSGWVKNQSSVSRDQYEKIKVVRVFLGSASPPYSATTYSAAHGITDWRTVSSWTCIVQEDSLNINILAGVSGNNAGSAGISFSNASVDSTDCRIRLGATSVNLFNDTAKFRIVYTDIDR